MIHHAGLEVELDHLDACVAFWELLGWAQVPSLVRRAPGASGGPEPTAARKAIEDPGRWLQRGVHQVHLQVRAAGEATAPAVGHLALVDPDLDATAERLAAAGFEVLERQRYWGARRVFTRCPAGHRVELMSAPPE